jgi:hypothetical protein
VFQRRASSVFHAWWNVKGSGGSMARWRVGWPNADPKYEVPVVRETRSKPRPLEESGQDPLDGMVWRY